jgi:hypothetical protein
MKNLTLATVLLSLTLFAGCGGGGGGAEGQCEDLLEVTCERSVECVGGFTQSECLDALDDQIPCGRADRVSSTYDACMTQLMGNACADLFPGGQLTLPPDCNQVIIIEE